MTEPIRIELPTFFGMKTVNCYLIKDPVPTLIDCGESTPAVWEALTAGLKGNGLTIKDIERLVITHAHVDHIGSAAWVAEVAGAEIWVSDLVQDWAINMKEMWKKRVQLMEATLKYFLGETVFGNISAPFAAMADMTIKAWPSLPAQHLHVFPHDGEIDLGGETWQAIHAPGHCSNQSCFFNPKNGHLLSADMLLKVTPAPVIDIKADNPNEREAGIFQLIHSYQKIRALDTSKVFPGHYEIFENPTKTIDNQLGRINLRKEECFYIIKKGKSAFWEIGMAMYANNFHLPAINMFVGYLDLLEAEGRIYYGEETGQGVQILAN